MFPLLPVTRLLNGKANKFAKRKKTLFDINENKRAVEEYDTFSVLFFELARNSPIPCVISRAIVKLISVEKTVRMSIIP